MNETDLLDQESSKNSKSIDSDLDSNFFEEGEAQNQQNNNLDAQDEDGTRVMIDPPEDEILKKKEYDLKQNEKKSPLSQHKQIISFREKSSSKIIDEQNSSLFQSNQDQKQITSIIFKNDESTQVSINKPLDGSEQVTPLPLVQKGVYSLESDIKLGWRPKEMTKPKYAFEVPPVVAFRYPEDDIFSSKQQLQQTNLREQKKRGSSAIILPNLVTQEASKESYKNSEQFQSQETKQPKNQKQMTIEDYIKNIMYQGFRPRDSLEIHESFRQKFYTFDFPQYQNLKKPNVQDISSMFNKDLNTEKSPLKFDSFFEAGNLDRVVKVNDFQYDLFLRPDTNTNGYCNWFYFKVNFNHAYFDNQNNAGGSGSTPINGETNKYQYRFNIVNMYKKFQLFCRDQKPLIQSKQKQIENPKLKSQWSKDGVSNVKYGPSKAVPTLGRKKKYYQLTFTYQFEYPQDEVMFAYSLPYSYSLLQQHIEQYKEIQRQVYKNEDAIFDSTLLCKSLSGLSIPLITITDFQDKKVDQKKIILIQGRVHPGETHASWIVHGLILQLLANDNLAKQLRGRFIFKIVPMINPDGVVFGNYRTCFLGKDMNRMFFANQEDALDKIDERLIPEIVAIRKLVAYCQSLDKAKVLGFFDVHQHSKRKSIFLYGPQYPLHHSSYSAVRVLPRILSSNSEEFRFYSCRFRNEDYKENCARMFIEREFNITFSYCIECSQQGFMNRSRQIVDFNEKNLTEFGKTLALSLLQFGVLIENQNKIVEQKIQSKMLKEQQKIESLKQLQLRRNETSRLKLEEKRFKDREKQLEQMNHRDNMQGSFSQFKNNDLSFDGIQRQTNGDIIDHRSLQRAAPLTNNLLIGRDISQMSLNDYINLMNNDNPYNEEINDSDLDSLEDKDCPSSGSESDDQEFSKEIQEQLYRDILKKFDITSKPQQHESRKQSIRITLQTQQATDEENNPPIIDDSFLSSRFDENLIKPTAIITKPQVIMSKLTYPMQQYLNLPKASVQNNNYLYQSNTSSFKEIPNGIVLPVKEYDFDQKSPPKQNRRKLLQQQLQQKVNYFSQRQSKSNFNAKNLIQNLQDLNTQSFHKKSQGSLSNNQSLRQLPVNNFNNQSLKNFPNDNENSYDQQPQPRTTAKVKIRIVFNSQQPQQRNKSLNNSASQSYILTAQNSPKNINQAIHTKIKPDRKRKERLNQNNSYVVKPKQLEVFSLQEQDPAQALEEKVQVRLFNDSLIRNDKLKDEYQKLKDIRQRIKRKQEILSKIGDKLTNYQSQQPSPLRDVVVFNHKDYMGFFQKSRYQESTNIRGVTPNNQVFFKKEKLPKNELNYIQPLPRYNQKLADGALICQPEKINRAISQQRMRDQIQ
ncbi:zinc carboxypeptidase family protein [Stylonychia lemnae]|uniref:Zinc carboxypeptidase family protein n=1 Tax=Stylonychia lemnae TaxID=5949 RepID=A0A078AWK5_STYLE|nr:zinc carboxypeptidase family protein [Stylonychia lemnae]|eukprot:CDW85188.1 zinc carboxypeptidase family protein [Stylonychia lemnae]